MTFTYWATLDVPPDQLGLRPAWGPASSGGFRPFVPFRIEGLATVDVRAGLYAVATVPSLAALPGAYGHVYDAWPKTQTEYAVDFDAPCFELYPAAWRDGDPFRLFVPLQKLA
jgi:DNA gyrase inhibitor GyrI